MDDDGARRLSAAIIIQAAEDMKAVHDKTIKLHKACCYLNGAICSSRKLTDYLVDLKKDGLSSWGKCLPFENQDDITAVTFFKADNSWGRTMLDLADMEELPVRLEEMIILLDDTAKRCVPCIEKFKKIAIKRIKTEEFEAECINV